MPGGCVHAAAIVDPRVVRAMTAGPTGRIALCFLEWASDGEQIMIIDWMSVGSEAEAQAVSKRIRVSHLICIVPNKPGVTRRTGPPCIPGMGSPLSLRAKMPLSKTSATGTLCSKSGFSNPMGPS